MAFFQLVLKANKLEKLRQSYEDEKLTSIEISKGVIKPVYTLKQRIHASCFYSCHNFFRNGEGKL
ncbi:hypothetical protein E2986_05482 [Frieseomelitta varia]|uniref:Uncharacterized protein n=1 Tax=Frieseomelitta varia TaxID=561572 RepID=A0A833VS23_9HYME|nr:hypothetical protein E2986_05482 [Frieseomelitta varia]